MTPESRAFVEALRRGDLDEATVVLDHCLAQGAYDSGPSLLDRCAVVCCALREGRLDAAASDLCAWEGQYREYLEPVERARMNALGLCLMRYFGHPESGGHEAFNGLLDVQLLIWGSARAETANHSGVMCSRRSNHGSSTTMASRHLRRMCGVPGRRVGVRVGPRLISGGSHYQVAPPFQQRLMAARISSRWVLSSTRFSSRLSRMMVPADES